CRTCRVAGRDLDPVDERIDGDGDCRSGGIGLIARVVGEIGGDGRIVDVVYARDGELARVDVVARGRVPLGAVVEQLNARLVAADGDLDERCGLVGIYREADHAPLGQQTSSPIV